MIRVGLEDAVDDGSGGVAPVEAELRLGELDPDIVGFLDLQLEPCLQYSSMASVYRFPATRASARRT